MCESSRSPAATTGWSAVTVRRSAGRYGRAVGEPVPGLVTLHLWRVPTRHIGSALARMALDRRPLRTTAGLGFAKLLGTGSGQTFTPGDVDPRRWGLLASWRTAADARAFATAALVRRWDRISEERWAVDLRPLSSRGCWSGRQPFGDPSPTPYDAAIAAITRARIAVPKTLTFWRAVPPVSAELHRSAGLRLALGIGEAPIGLQGTFSLWDSPAALRDFAHRRPAHALAIRRTTEERWYTEELFARFAVLSAEGTVDGRDPLR